MPIVNRAVADEPPERPNELGRALLRVAREHPGEWRCVYESDNRSRVVYLEGCLLGRAAGRVPGVTDISGWDARCVEVETTDGVPLFELRVRYEGKPQPGQQTLAPVQ